jgi:DNA-binding GntR family transcriptional regulator
LIGRLNNEFHFELISSCGNVHARQVAMTLGNLNIALGSYAMESREVLMRSMIYHKELIDALKARNPGWARSVMVAHLESGRAVVAARVAVPEVDAAKPAKGHKPARRKTAATLKG